MPYNLVILLMLVLAPARGGDRAAAPRFSTYPQTDSFQFFWGTHTNSAWHLQHTSLLAITAFLSGDRIALRYFVTESGLETDYRDVHNWAMQAPRRKQLSEVEIKDLRSAIGDLPAESASPPIERLVIMSFRETTNWVTRSHDSSDLPAPLRLIYNLIGERSESKKTDDAMTP